MKGLGLFGVQVYVVFLHGNVILHWHSNTCPPRTPWFLWPPLVLMHFAGALRNLPAFSSVKRNFWLA